MTATNNWKTNSVKSKSLQQVAEKSMLDGQLNYEF